MVLRLSKLFLQLFTVKRHVFPWNLCGILKNGHAAKFSRLLDIYPWYQCELIDQFLADFLFHVEWKYPEWDSIYETPVHPSYCQRRQGDEAAAL